ncbi:MAG: GTPase ObgE [Caldilineaceae bacterium]
MDRARVLAKAGDGGNGVMAFRREKYVPMGGPNGGNGGRGGHVCFYVDLGMNTLSHFKQQVHLRAERGGHGEGADRTGHVGKDLRVPVPPGTIVRDAETKEVLVDLTEEGQEFIVAHGGRGGRGNAAFKSPRNPAPRLAEKGEPGEERWLELELKLVADVGIVGVPNAGKSTLLSVISAARPKIADYPFTTLTPVLGVVEVDYQPIVVADIPGLLEGAHEGVGLGLQFLRHIDRTRMLIHLLRGDSPDPLGDFEAINQELQLFNPAVLDKPQIVVLNKMDLPEAQAAWPTIEAEMNKRNLPVFAISAATHQGLEPLLYKLKEVLNTIPKNPEPAEEVIEISLPVDEKAFDLQKVDDHTWLVEGITVERAARMTNWTYYEGAMRFQRILAALGVTEALRQAGVKEGDSVRIAETELTWGYDNAFGE